MAPSLVLQSRRREADSVRSPAQWGDAVGQAAAVREYAAAEQVFADLDRAVTLFHDVSDDVTKTLRDGGQPGQAMSIFDRLFLLSLQRRLARERLEGEAETIPAGELPDLPSGSTRPVRLLKISGSRWRWLSGDL